MNRQLEESCLCCQSWHRDNCCNRAWNHTTGDHTLLHPWVAKKKITAKELSKDFDMAWANASPVNLAPEADAVEVIVVGVKAEAGEGFSDSENVSVARLLFVVQTMKWNKNRWQKQGKAPPFKKERVWACNTIQLPLTGSPSYLLLTLLNCILQCNNINIQFDLLNLWALLIFTCTCSMGKPTEICIIKDICQHHSV